MTEVTIKRLAQNAGIKCLTPFLYEKVRRLLQHHLEDVIAGAIVSAEYLRKTTIQEQDVRESLKLLGRSDDFEIQTGGLLIEEEDEIYDEGLDPDLIDIAYDVDEKLHFVPYNEHDDLYNENNNPVFGEQTGGGFHELIMEITHNLNNSMHLSDSAINLIQLDSENYIIDLLTSSD